MQRSTRYTGGSVASYAGSRGAVLVGVGAAEVSAEASDDAEGAIWIRNPHSLVLVGLGSGV